MIEPYRSWWLRQALTEPPCPAPVADQRADVAIIGGGFVGLWTELRLKDLEPALDVLVLEADVCGGGAAGRNGGMALPWTKAPEPAQDHRTCLMWLLVRKLESWRANVGAAIGSEREPARG